MASDGHRGSRHRVSDLASDFDDDDLEAFARSAEKAADDPALSLGDAIELYSSADVARAAAIRKRGRK
mgnify:CR=1 FL=1